MFPERQWHVRYGVTGRTAGAGCERQRCLDRLDMEITPAGLAVQRSTEIASEYQHRCDPATFVAAPAGLVYEPAFDALIVASTLDNAVFAVPHGGTSHQ